jgi:hypothetical protein
VFNHGFKRKGTEVWIVYAYSPGRWRMNFPLGSSHEKLLGKEKYRENSSLELEQKKRER